MSVLHKNTAKTRSCEGGGGESEGLAFVSCSIKEH